MTWLTVGMVVVGAAKLVMVIDALWGTRRGSAGRDGACVGLQESLVVDRRGRAAKH
jgi:hypothetical protein